MGNLLGNPRALRRLPYAAPRGTLGRQTKDAGRATNPHQARVLESLKASEVAAKPSAQRYAQHTFT
jgi:hypothetical protein